MQKPIQIKTVTSSPKDKIILELSVDTYLPKDEDRVVYQTLEIYHSNNTSHPIYLTSYEEIDNLIVALGEAKIILKEKLEPKVIAEDIKSEAKWAKRHARDTAKRDKAATVSE